MNERANDIYYDHSYNFKEIKYFTFLKEMMLNIYCVVKFYSILLLYYKACRPPVFIFEVISIV